MTGTLKLKSLSLRLGERFLVQELSAIIEPGEILTFMGESGSGKSSLLHLISGFLTPDFVTSGDVFLGETDLLRLPPEKRRLGLMGQSPLLFPHLSVAGNLAFALPRYDERGWRLSRLERKRAIKQALEQAELAGFGNKDPATLSGGQKARIALTCSLLSRPSALLLDEPFSALDAGLRARQREFVFGHARNAGLPTLLVTHDRADAKATGGRVIQMNSLI